MNSITNRQREVLSYVMEYLVEHDPFSPSLSDIAKKFGTTQQSASAHVKSLIAKGYLKRHSHQKFRNLIVMDRVRYDP